MTNPLFYKTNAVGVFTILPQKPQNMQAKSIVFVTSFFFKKNL